MCFSPTASFASSALLLVAGTAIYRKATRDREKLLAAIPLLFAAQQFIEGLLWLALLHGLGGKTSFGLTQSYAAFAGMIWPTFVPLSLLKIEHDSVRKFFIFMGLATGCGLAVYAFYVIATVGVTAEIKRACISYNYAGNPLYYCPLMIAYAFATCLPFLVVKDRMLHLTGFLYFIALGISFYWYKFAFVSVWCFFSAPISTGIYFYIRAEAANEKFIIKSKVLASRF